MAADHLLRVEILAELGRSQCQCRVCLVVDRLPPLSKGLILVELAQTVPTCTTTSKSQGYRRVLRRTFM